MIVYCDADDCKWNEDGKCKGPVQPAGHTALYIRQYEQEREEKITKGDVVRMKSAPEVEILVTYADEERISGIALTEVDDCCEIGDQYTDIVKYKVEKAGRHYEIAEVLQKMREE